jgi:hypothetical protein
VPSILVCTFPVIETKYAYEFRNKKRQGDVLLGAEDSDPSGTPTIKLSFFGFFLVDVSEVFSYFFKNLCSVLEGHVLLFYF